VEATENPGRGRILQRIQTALRAPAKPPAASTASTLFSPVPNPLVRFQQECVANNTECVLAGDSAASAAAVSSLVTSFPPGEIFVQDEPSLRRMELTWNSHAVRWSSEGAPQECSQATITLAEWLVAETASVFSFVFVRGACCHSGCACSYCGGQRGATRPQSDNALLESSRERNSGA
jgi:hypothetical protein